MALTDKTDKQGIGGKGSTQPAEFNVLEFNSFEFNGGVRVIVQVVNGLIDKKGKI